MCTWQSWLVNTTQLILHVITLVSFIYTLVAEKSTQTNFILPEQSVPAEPTGSVIAGMDSSLPGASYVEPMLNLILRYFHES